MDRTLKKIRESIGFTQEQVSTLTGVPVKTLRNWEQGLRSPSKWALDLVIDKLLQIHIDEQFSLDEATFSLDEKVLINLNYDKWIDNLPVGYSSHKLILNDDGVPYDYSFIGVNSLFETYTGLKAKNVIGKTVLEVLPNFIDSDFNWIAYYSNIALNNKSGEFVAYSEPLKKSYKVKVFSPEYLYFIVFFSDYSLEPEYEDRIKNNMALFRNSVKNAPVPIMIHAEDGEVIGISDTWTEISGYSHEEIPTTRHWTQMVYGSNREEINKVIDKSFDIESKKHVGEFLIRAKNGKTHTWDFHTTSLGKLPDNRKIAMSVALDISDLKQKENELRYTSYHDSLTGLYNRKYYEKTITTIDVPENYPIAIVMADINGLKLINDAFGHTIGDNQIVAATNLIQQYCHNTDLVARIGGDEFVIIMTKTSVEKVEAFVDTISVIAPNINVESINLSMSFGYAIKSNNNQDIQSIYQSAEDAMYRSKLLEIPSMRSGAIETILQTLYEKDRDSELHSRNVSHISEKLATACKMTSQQIAEIKTVGLLHDIGKIIIPTNIIVKKGSLTDEEYRLIKGHPEIGYRILNSSQATRELSKYVLYHHERWDGLGYPRGIKMNDIPIQSRIIAIADAVDAMTNERSYRKVFTKEQALQEIIRNAGTQFDPEIVKVFQKKFHQILKTD